MFTDAVSVADHELIIGATVMWPDVVADNARAFLAAARSFHGNLFLDPDTGLSHKRIRSAARVSIDEFRDIVFRAPAVLTVIFDQGFSPCATATQRRQAMLGKLERRCLGHHGIRHGPADIAN